MASTRLMFSRGEGSADRRSVTDCYARGVRLEELDYLLPDDRIARFPAPRREEARLLIHDRASGARTHARIPALLERVRPGDVLVVNDVRVAPARLLLRRASGGAAEALVIREEGGEAEILLDGRGRARPGERLSVVGSEAFVVLVE